MSIVITAQNIRKSYKDLKAVDGLSFEVEQSSCFGLLGPNGAGKTTMMKMIYGKGQRDVHPDDKLTVFGFDPKHQELQIKAMSGVVSQDDNLDAELSVFNNLMIFSRFYGMNKSDAKSRIEELLDFMELTEKRKSRIEELSGGMKRRLTIARALMNRPKLLILDEPTTGLDPQVRHLIWNKLRELKSMGVTILLTTHYMEEAFQICDKILIMYKGKKMLEGKPVELLETSIEPYVLELMDKSSMPIIEKLIDPKLVREDNAHDLKLFYSKELDVLKNAANNLTPGTYYLRQSNLEDLFLKLTGRGLNEEQ